MRAGTVGRGRFRRTNVAARTPSERARRGRPDVLTPAPSANAPVAKASSAGSAVPFRIRTAKSDPARKRKRDVFSTYPLARKLADAGLRTSARAPIAADRVEAPSSTARA